jgi:hypothetical protein
MAFSTPSDAGRSRNASSGEAGELAVLGLASGGATEADAFGTPDVDVAELPPLGEAEVVQAATIAAITIKQTGRKWIGRRIMATPRDPEPTSAIGSAHES